MEPIASNGRRAVFLREMAPDDELASPFDGEPYPVLVWASGVTSAEQKGRLCARLIASGCRYVVCGGVESAGWETAVDEAFIQQDLSDDEFDERHVMTTSHEGEPVDEVVFFFIHNTNVGAHDFTRYLVLMIGDDPPVREQLVASIRDQVAAAR